MTSDPTPTVRTVKVCTIAGCEKPHRARGLCSTHYNQQLQPNRHAKVHDRECVVCGAPVQRKSTRHLPTCSYRCRRDLTFGISEPIPEDHPARWFGASCPWSPPKPKPTRARFVVCHCAECGEQYTVDRTIGGWRETDSFCSMRCVRRVRKRARRGRERGRAETFRWPDVIGIWLRQGRTCSYCRIVMSEQPEPDHVLALARGGRNDLSNILPCCRACNGEKGTLTLGEWATQRASRGLPPLVYDYVTYDPRAPHLVVSQPEQLAA